MRKSIIICLLILCVNKFVDAQQFVLTPQWTPQSQFAAFYVAIEKGFYKEAGLDVEIVHPSQSSTSIDRLKEGSCNIVTLELTNAIKLADEGLDLVNLLQICNHSNNVIIFANEMTNYQGIRVGVPKYSLISDMYETLKEKDIELIHYLNAVNIFVTKTVDAIYGKSYNELIKINMTGATINNVMYMRDLGYDVPEDGLYVTKDFYRQYPEQCEEFAKVTKKAWEWVRDNVDETVDIVMKYVRDANIISNDNHQKAMLEEYMNSMRRCNDEYCFVLRDTDFEKVCKTLKQHNIIKSDLKYSNFVGDVL